MKPWTGSARDPDNRPKEGRAPKDPDPREFSVVRLDLTKHLFRVRAHLADGCGIARRSPRRGEVLKFFGGLARMVEKRKGTCVWTAGDAITPHRRQ
jgi:hypothetical protein